MNAPQRLYLRTPGLADAAQTFLASGVLSPGPLWIVDTAARRFGEDDPEILLALALVLQAQDRGHVGLDLRHAPEALPIPEHIPEQEQGAEPTPSPAWPADLAAWELRVLGSGMVGPRARPFVANPRPGGGTLILSQRVAREQERLVQALVALAEAPPQLEIPEQDLDGAIARLFPKEPQGQGALALRAAAARCLTVITGGPGTGKTWSIKRLLALLLERESEGRALRVVLAAPTGKAAVRMTEAMGEDLDELPIAEPIQERLEALPAQTVHKLLRIRPDSGATRYGKDEPLPADLVVVDEASMLDLVLMRKLVEAVAPGARLVLLGDRDQLASVEAGTVLADIVGGHFEGREGPMKGRIVPFHTNYRSKHAPTVAAIGAAIQSKQEDQIHRAVALMTGTQRIADDPKPDRVRWLEPQPVDGRPEKSLLDALAAPYLTEGEGYAQQLATLLRVGGRKTLRDPGTQRALLDALDRYRVLAVHRRGPLGVSGLLRTLGERVRDHVLQGWQQRPSRDGSPPNADRRAKEQLPTRGGLWLGQPVLVTVNAYDVDLRNGDIGLVLPTREHELAVVFPVSRAGSRDVRAVPIPRLPAHMGALAMTVHKSQGSQFDHVAVVLAGRKSPIQTRELVYTAVTRAKARVSWVGGQDELLDALSTPVGRVSGLGERLW
jgi:exodeoxyribonuclease V alpha subunit